MDALEKALEKPEEPLETDPPQNARIVEENMPRSTAQNPLWTELNAHAGSATRLDTLDAIARKRSRNPSKRSQIKEEVAPYKSSMVSHLSAVESPVIPVTSLQIPAASVRIVAPVGA